MTFKAILAPMTGNAAQGVALRIAIQIAKTFNGTLIGLYTRPDPRTMIPYIGDGMTSDIIKDLIDAAEREGKTQGDAMLATFRAACAEYGLELNGGQPGAEWRVDIGQPEEMTSRAARLADLTVVARPVGKEQNDSLGVLDGVLLLSGKPVLLVPPGISSSFGKTAVIAWNGSAEGARAVSMALPFLTAAERVVIVGIGARDEVGSEPSALARYLKRYGVESEHREIPRATDATGPALLSLAADINADLIVMGAYTHTRLRQIIFGGVTRYVLENAQLPTLMSH